MITDCHLPLVGTKTAIQSMKLEMKTEPSQLLAALPCHNIKCHDATYKDNFILVSVGKVFCIFEAFLKPW